MQQPGRSDNETRETILRTAANLFLERGYAKTKVMDIVKVAGITPSTMYWHFESKGDLLFEYLRANINDFNAIIAEAIEGIDDPVERLRTLAVAHTTAQLSFREQAQVVLSMTRASAELIAALPKERADEVNELIRVHVDVTKQTVDRGIEQGIFRVPDAHALTFAVLNICENAALWFRPGGSLTIEAVATANGEFAVRMAVGADRPTPHA